MKRNFSPIVEKKLGQILVDKGIISSRFVQLALDRQEIEKGKYIGEILIAMGISQETIDEVLDVYNKRRPIGQIFLDLKIITPDQLQEALEKQNQLAKMAVRKSLGKLLVEMGFTTYERYMDALSKHLIWQSFPSGAFSPQPPYKEQSGKLMPKSIKSWSWKIIPKGSSSPSLNPIPSLWMN